MTKYILHGGYTSETNELNQSYFAEMVRDVPDGGNMLLVYFASDEESVDHKFKKDSRRMHELAPDKKITFTKATEHDFVEQLKAADVIYIRGGDTQKLKTALDSYPEFVGLIQGKTVSGSSAGAYILSKYYFTNSLNRVMEGYGCAPVRVVCHYQSDIHPAPENVDPVAAMEAYDNNLELVLLKDHEWKMIEV